MGDNGIAGPPAKKRGASRQISKDDGSDSEGDNSVPLESGSFQKASEEVLASRRIVKVRRTPAPAPTAAAAPNPFASIRLVAPSTAMSAPVVPFAPLASAPMASEGGCNQDSAAIPNEVDEKGLGGHRIVKVRCTSAPAPTAAAAPNHFASICLVAPSTAVRTPLVPFAPLVSAPVASEGGFNQDSAAIPNGQDGKVVGSATVAEDCGKENGDCEGEGNSGILKIEGGDHHPVLVASKEDALGDGDDAKGLLDGGSVDNKPVLVSATDKGSGDDGEGQPDAEGKGKTEVSQSDLSEQIGETEDENLAAPSVPSSADKTASKSPRPFLGTAFPGSFSFDTAPSTFETPTAFASFSSTRAAFGSGSASGTSSVSAFAFKAANEGAFTTPLTAFGSSNGSTFQLFSTQTGANSLTAAPSSQPPASSIQFQEVLVQTGEEQEKVVFGADATLFEFMDCSWKEHGKGELKVNISEDKTAKSRLLMRGKGNYKLLLNAGLFPDMKLTSMDSRGITFACVNSAAEGKKGLTTYAVKFKDSLSAGNFRDAVDSHKSVPCGGLKTPENSPRALHES